MPLRGVIFDLDGTLVDSRLDFEAIRADLGLAAGESILEALAAMPAGPEKEKCLDILHEHEQRGAAAATLIPGADTLLERLAERNVKTGILTRNSRASTMAVLDRFGWEFNQVITREDGPPKPDAAGLLAICRTWEISVDEALFFGDFHFDLQAGRQAKMRTVLLATDGRPDYADEADFVVQSLGEGVALIDQLLALD